MNFINKEEVLKRSSETLSALYDMLLTLPAVGFNELQPDKTALVVIDMVNGFAREGALKSTRIEAIIPEIVKLSEMCDEQGIRKIAFADCHTEASPEFKSYPAHCIEGSSEAEIVDELRDIGGYTLIRKNSTNGFLEDKFKIWLEENSTVDTFIITGDCTDICIQQFAVTLKTWFNRNNRKSRVIVPLNTVETYDLELHNSELVNIMALYSMMINGVEVVKKVEGKLA